MQTIHIIIKGKVQGVYFRESTKQKANALNITGTVENLADGDVQIFATGDESAIKELLKWCHQGPPGARVSEVKSVQSIFRSFENFVVKR